MASAKYFFQNNDIKTVLNLLLYVTYYLNMMTMLMRNLSKSDSKQQIDSIFIDGSEKNRNSLPYSGFTYNVKVLKR